MSYPSSIDSFTAVTGADTIASSHINTLQAAIVAVETELGTDPAGSAADLSTRLAQSISAAGNLDFASSTSLTISAGAVTPTQNFHRIDTESAAASDDLTTLTATNVTDGFLLVIRPTNSARAIVIKHEASGGNISCVGGADLTLGDDTEWALCIYDGNLSKWLVMSVAGITLTAGRKSTVAKSAAYTATVTDDVILCSASGGAYTVGLPAASTAYGLTITVKKIDSSANAVTIDGNGSETIDGATTKVLSTQWEKATLRCDGSNWYVI